MHPEVSMDYILPLTAWANLGSNFRSKTRCRIAGIQQARGRTSQDANQPSIGGESAIGRKSQGANEPGGEPAKGRKNQIPDARR